METKKEVFGGGGGVVPWMSDARLLPALNKQENPPR